jgi:hypothetical protein
MDTKQIIQKLEDFRNLLENNLDNPYIVKRTLNDLINFSSEYAEKIQEARNIQDGGDEILEHFIYEKRTNLSQRVLTFIQDDLNPAIEFIKLTK